MIIKPINTIFLKKNVIKLINIIMFHIWGYFETYAIRVKKKN